MKATAVEWLKKNLEDYGSNSHLSLDWNTFDEFCEQAKEMEKEQIIEAYQAAEKDCGRDFLHGDLYYNEIYKSE